MPDLAAWEYHDWDSNPKGSATRLTELNAHIAEVRLSFQRAAFGSFNTQNKTHTRDADSIQRYLQSLEKARAEEEAVPGATSSTTGTSFVRMRPSRE